MSLDGLLLIDKPKGWTSFDVVAKVRGIVKQKTGLKRPKIGHAGTLDPLATGLLLVLLGSYCKQAQSYSKLDKTYHVSIKLGFTSTTGDGEGEMTRKSHDQPPETAIKTALTSFVGQIQQTPPAYSAIKVDGQRAYKLARSGASPQMKPRTVTIYAITEASYNYPDLEFVTEVSSGTYIRSLARDIGEKLGTGAYLTNLRRTRVGDFNIQRAHQIDTISSDNISQLLV